MESILSLNIFKRYILWLFNITLSLQVLGTVNEKQQRMYSSTELHCGL